MADTVANSQTLRPDTWTNLGAAPCFVQMIGSNPVAFILSAAAPEAPADKSRAAHVLDERQNSVSIGFSGTVWARAFGDKPAAVVVTR